MPRVVHAGRPTSLFHADRHLTRRKVVQLSAAGVSAGLIAGAAPAVAATEPATEAGGWTASDIPSQRGRRVLVTGGNGFPEGDRSGLGYHQAIAFARAGADVTIASRRQARGEEALRRILAEVPGAAVRFEPLDLANLASVAAFAARMKVSSPSLDVLVNNAGVMGRLQREVSADGFERVLATNTVGHFALTTSLLPLLRAGREPRIVWVCSMRMSKAIHFDDLQLERDYRYAEAYDQSKLANLTLAYEFQRRSQTSGWGVASLAAHPGVARTNLIPDGPGLDSVEGERFRTLPTMFQPAAQGALPLLYAATSPQAAAGGYYGPTGGGGLRGPPGIATPPEVAKDPQSAARLWTTLKGLVRAPRA